MNYAVFVAEDEPRVREGIRNHLENNPRYQLCGEAADGEMSLSAILELKPDILITDIKMPFMDGLALSRAVKRAMPRTKILIISGHDEFEFAKQAISIGVDEYLLKPVSAKILFEALDKISAVIEEEQKSLKNKDSSRQLERQEELRLRDGFFDELLTGALSTTEVLERAEHFGISFPAKCYLVAEMELRYDEAQPEAALHLRQTIGNLLENREDAMWCLRGSDRVVVIAKGENREAVDQTIYEVVLALRDELEQVLGLQSTTFIGMLAERIAGIPMSYKEAHALMRRFPNLAEGSVINHEDFENDYLQYLTTSMDEPMARKLRHAALPDIDRILDQTFGENGQPIGSSLYAYYRFSDLMLAAARIVNESGGKAVEIFPELSDAKMLGRASSPEEVFAMARDLLTRFIAYKQQVSGNLKYGDSLARAKEFIYENHSDTGISLNTVAAYTGFSPNHFSTIFSQNTGETFIAFLTRVRMEKAKNLLQTTEESSADIAYKTGYTDSNYFRYLFKKHYGVSPREFRGMNREK